MSDPGKDDFETILPEDEDVDIGHICYGGFKIKDGTASGSVATFQIEYISGDANETYYIVPPKFAAPKDLGLTGRVVCGCELCG